MSLQPRTTAPGKARRAASVGKPKRTKKAAEFKAIDPKARHTTAQKNARKGAAALGKSAVGKSAVAKSSKAATTRRYSDSDPSTISKKEVRLTDRSKLRAQRFQEKTASRPRPLEASEERKTRIELSQKPESRAKKFVAERTERAKRPLDKKPDFKKTEYKKSDTRPTNRRDAALAKVSRTVDGRPNFIPRKVEKFDPTRPKKRSEAPDTRAANFRAERPARDRRNESPAYARDDFKHSSKTHTNAAVDFGADDNYISANLADANLIDATPLTEITTTFSDLGIAAPLVNALAKQGIIHPFPIQIATLPDALAGYDILGRGQTGSGKTLAFGLALLNNLNGRVAKPHKPLALVLTPTRELAQQIDEVLMPLARSIGHESVVVAGGMSYAKQITAMRRGTAILVATPGRLIDLLNKGEVQLDQLEITVLDEADQMADMGFLPVVKEILDQAKLDGQRLLFSATLDRGVDSLVRQYLKNPKTHSLQNDRASVSTMDHFVLVMNPGDKDDITNQIAARNGKTIMFVKTQRGADRLADKLAHAGVAVGALHGGKTQAVRTRTLALFKESANAALVATDVAARGIHVDGISLVVHVDAPTDHKDYLHRAGRTARAGEAGTVVTIATTKQQKSIGGLTSRAGVTPKFVGVTPLSTELMKITGAQEPSGIPYIVPIVEKSVRSGGNKRPRPNSSQRRRRPH
ncbi:MAG: DEAD/DEAH box helicase [Candidatus Planktophila sp.]|nr:DEAD/DEAH box helicase [Candidatus Planktophila sp.]